MLKLFYFYEENTLLYSKAFNDSFLMKTQTHFMTLSVVLLSPFKISLLLSWLSSTDAIDCSYGDFSAGKNV